MASRTNSSPGLRLLLLVLACSLCERAKSRRGTRNEKCSTSRTFPSSFSSSRLLSYRAVVYKRDYRFREDRTTQDELKPRKINSDVNPQRFILIRFHCHRETSFLLATKLKLFATNTKNFNDSLLSSLFFYIVSSYYTIEH